MGLQIAVLVLSALYALAYAISAFMRKNAKGGVAAVFSALLPLGMAAALYFGFVRG